MDEKWKEAIDTFRLLLENKDLALLSTSVFTALSFALSAYSQQTVRWHKEDQAALPLNELNKKSDGGFCMS